MLRCKWKLVSGSWGSTSVFNYRFKMKVPKTFAILLELSPDEKSLLSMCKLIMKEAWEHDTKERV